ncbi:lipid II flippase MurJ, partial [Wolbachia sp. wRi_2]
SLMCLGINVVLNLLLMNKYQHTGIAIATSVSTWINSILLISYLTINKMYKVSQALLLNIMKIFVATAVMSIALYIFNSLLAGLFFDKMLARIVYLATLIALSVIVYFGTLYLTFRGSLNNLKYV